MSETACNREESEKDIFLKALEIESAEERNSFLIEACGGDELLRLGVESLLKADSEGEDWSLESDDLRDLEREREVLAVEIGEEEQFLKHLESKSLDLGNYRVVEEIGRGAMGVVLRARQKNLNREVAVKVLLNSALSTPEDRQRFRIEAEAAARLDHPNIVPIYEIGSHDGHDYYSMALIEGNTLGKETKENGLEARAAVRLISKVAKAVQSAHSLGIIHRDLKPDNILLDSEGEPHVADFGLACWLDRESNLTLTGQFMGTPQYMAPELVSGDGRPSTATDVYALGAILYELLARKPPFRGNSVVSTFRLIEEEMPASLRSLRPTLDRDLETIVFKCLEKAPEKRYPSVRALASDLDAWLELRPISARAPSTVERVQKWIRRRPAFAAILSVLVIILVVLGIGGPVVAIYQNQLRLDAQTSESIARAAQRKAEIAADRSKQQAMANRRLLYSSNQRYIQLAHELLGDSSLAAETMVFDWRPGNNEMDLRGWEWYFNFGRIHNTENTFNIGSPVVFVDINPYGNAMAACGSEGTEIRDPLSSALVRRLSDGSGHRKADWGPSGERIVTLSGDGSVHLWNSRDGSERILMSGERKVSDLDWGAPEKLVTLSEGEIQLWRVSEESKLEGLGAANAGDLSLRRVALSNDGKYVAAVGVSHDLYVWEVERLDASPLIYEGASSPLISLEWQNDGRWIAASTEAGVIRTWGVPSGRRAVRYDTKSELPIIDFAWNPNGAELALLLAGDYQLDMVDFVASKGRPLRGFSHLARPLSLAWSANCHTIAIGTEEGKVILHRNGLPDAKQVLFEAEAPLVSLGWTPDGRNISCHSASGQLYRVDSLTMEVSPPKLVKGLRRDSAFAWNPDSGIFAFVQGSRLRMIARRPDFKFDGAELPSESVAELVWTTNRDVLACTHGGAVYVVGRDEKVREDEFERPEEHAGVRYHSFSVSPDGNHLLGSGSESRVTLWSCGDGRIVWDTMEAGSGNAYRALAWHPDGNSFAAADEEGMIAICNMDSESPVREFNGHRGPIHGLAWHPHGDRLASAGRSGIIRLWDITNGELVLNMQGHGQPVAAIGWDREGSRLASCGADGTLRIWDATAGFFLSKD